MANDLKTEILNSCQPKLLAKVGIQVKYHSHENFLEIKSATAGKWAAKWHKALKVSKTLRVYLLINAAIFF